MDPDAPSPLDPSMAEWLHWLVVNIPGEASGPAPAGEGSGGSSAITASAGGRALMSYSGPSPPKGTHRYIFYAFEQPGSGDMEVRRAPRWAGHQPIESVVLFPLACCSCALSIAANTRGPATAAPTTTTARPAPLRLYTYSLPPSMQGPSSACGPGASGTVWATRWLPTTSRARRQAEIIMHGAVRNTLCVRALPARLTRGVCMLGRRPSLVVTCVNTLAVDKLLVHVAANTQSIEGDVVSNPCRQLCASNSMQQTVAGFVRAMHRGDRAG